MRAALVWFGSDWTAAAPSRLGCVDNSSIPYLLFNALVINKSSDAVLKNMS